MRTPCVQATAVADVDSASSGTATRPGGAVPLCASPHRHYGAMNYAVHSVPAPQLELLLSTFSRSRWTVLRYETLFDRRRSVDETVRWLGGLFGLALANGTRQELVRRRRACSALGKPVARASVDSKTTVHVNSFRSSSRLDTPSEEMARAMLAPRHAAIYAVIEQARRRGVRLTLE